MSLKSILQSISSFSPVRWIVRGFMKVGDFWSRFRSNLKYRALVPDCSNSICHHSVEIKYGENISVGENSRIGKNCTLGAKGKIVIGKNVVISKFVTVETAGLNLDAGPPFNDHNSSPIFIEDNVWIGTQSIILSGVRIGANSIIGAGTIVTKDVPPNSIVVGSGNRKIK